MPFNSFTLVTRRVLYIFTIYLDFVLFLTYLSDINKVCERYGLLSIAIGAERIIAYRLLSTYKKDP